MNGTVDLTVVREESRRVTLGSGFVREVKVQLIRRDGLPDMWAMATESRDRCFWAPERAIMDWAMFNDLDVTAIDPDGEPTRAELLASLRSLLDCVPNEAPALVFVKLTALVVRRECRILRDRFLAEPRIDPSSRLEMEKLNLRGDGDIDESPDMLQARALVLHALLDPSLRAQEQHRRDVRAEMKRRCIEVAAGAEVGMEELHDLRDYANDAVCAKAAPRVADDLIRLRLELERLSVADAPATSYADLPSEGDDAGAVRRLQAYLDSSRKALAAMMDKRWPT